MEIVSAYDAYKKRYFKEKGYKFENQKLVLIIQKTDKKTPQSIHQIKSDVLDMGEIETKYGIARHNKIYGDQSSFKENLSEEFFRKIQHLSKLYSDKYFKITISAYFMDDVGEKIKNLFRTTFEEKVLSILRIGGVIYYKENSSRKLTMNVSCRGASLNTIIKIVKKFHICSITLQNKQDKTDSGVNIGFYSKISRIQKRIKSEFTHNNYYPKNRVRSSILKPTEEQYLILEKIAPSIFTWIKDKMATTLCPVVNEGMEEVCYYRNTYEYIDGKKTKFPLIYSDLDVLQEQIGLKRAFAWVPDSHYEVNGIPKGPYCATIDLDPKVIEYEEFLKWVYEFHTFLKEEVGITPILCQSGNLSYHFSIFLAEPESNQRAYLLPKLTSFSSYLRRRADELNITFIRDAIEIILLYYNEEYTNLDKVSIRIPKYSAKRKFKVYHDLRTGIHTGARIPGCFHSKSGRFSRIFSIDQIPQNQTELESLTSGDYISTHPEYISKPGVSESTQKKNLSRIFEFANDYYSSNFFRLVYKQKIFSK